MVISEADTTKIVNSLRVRAKELLESGEVKVIIGYGEGYTKGKAVPVFITDPGKTDQLIFDARCVNNLSMYLKHAEIKAMGKVGIVAKGCDARAINVLILESQFKREDIFILGVVCEGVGDPIEEQCKSCVANTPPVYDELFGEPIENRGWNDETFAKIEELESMTQPELWKFWVKEFDRCIKCYACREACPMCTCTRCITDKNQPQWVPTSPHSDGNYHWNLTRAFHLVGRCVGCNSCERACPMDIPLSLINWKLIKAVHDEYEFIAGMDAETPPPLATYKEGEETDFIK
jgi:ferredoxin